MVFSVIFIILFGSVLIRRKRVRRRLREKLVERGQLICIPCGYDLTGNVSGMRDDDTERVTVR